MAITHQIQYLELKGNHFRRGALYGEKMAPQIRKSIRNLKTVIKFELKKDPHTFFSTFYQQQRYLPAIEKYTPDLLNEIEGIAQGSGCPFEEIFMLQLGDEFYTYAGNFETNLAAVQCSSLGVEKTPKNPSIIGQNLDWDITGEGAYVLLKIFEENSDDCSLAISPPGCIGTMGINNQSVAICTNAIWTQTNNSLSGLPVNFIVREVLTKRSYDEAIRFLKLIPHSTGENYIIGDKNSVGCFECSPNKIAEFIPVKEPKRIYHTNHLRINDDIPFPSREGKNGKSSQQRFDYLEYMMHDLSFQLDIDGFKEILRSHLGGICRHHNYTISSAYTWASAIFILAEKSKAFFTPGPPCENEYLEFGF